MADLFQNSINNSLLGACTAVSETLLLGYPALIPIFIGKYSGLFLCSREKCRSWMDFLLEVSFVVDMARCRDASFCFFTSMELIPIAQKVIASRF